MKSTAEVRYWHPKRIDGGANVLAEPQADEHGCLSTELNASDAEALSVLLQAIADEQAQRDLGSVQPEATLILESAPACTPPACGGNTVQSPTALAEDANAPSVIATGDTAGGQHANSRKNSLMGVMQLEVAYETRVGGDYTVVSGRTTGSDATDFRISIKGIHGLKAADFTHS